MPLEKITIGPFARSYVGSYNGVDVLSTIFAINTGTTTLTDEVPEQYEQSIDNSIQTGNRRSTA